MPNLEPLLVSFWDHLGMRRQNIEGKFFGVSINAVSQCQFLAFNQPNVSFQMIL